MIDSAAPRDKGLMDARLLAGIALALVLGFIIRAIPILTADFPLNDGGLFYIMTQELQAAHYRLPDYSSYNALHIPFAYSPLAFYGAGLLADLTHADLLDVFRFVPLVITTMTILAFAAFAQALLRSRSVVIAAVLAFALIPRTFIWLLMGGGLTRSVGFLCAILALHQAYLAFTAQRTRHIVLGAVFSALTGLSHLGTVPFLVFSIALLFVFFGRHRYGFAAATAIGLGMVLLTAPWWGAVLAVHGPAPFLAARATGPSILSGSEATLGALSWLAHMGVGSFRAGITGEAFFPLIGTLALYGALASVADRQVFLVVWWLVILVLELRAGATYASIPIAMLAGTGAMRLAPLLGFAVSARVAGPPANGVRTSWISTGWRGWLRPIRARGAALAILALIGGYVLMSAVVKYPGSGSELRYLVSLGAEERRALSVAATTPPSSRFLVMPESPYIAWGADKHAEWFPVLAQRVSVATVQGTEWINGDLFQQHMNHWKWLTECDHSSVQCLDDWSRRTGKTFTHVYIPLPTRVVDPVSGQCCQLLIHSLRADPRYQEVYSGPGAMIFMKR